MANYQTPEERKFRYETIAKAEGERCIVCWCDEHRLRRPPRKTLIIEHADDNKTNWAWSNLHLVCYSHNKIMADKTSWPISYKKNKIREYADQVKSEREREGLPTWNDVLTEELDYDGSPVELRLHKKYHPEWLKVLHQRIKSDGAITKKEAVQYCGYAAGCAKQTSENYLFMATAPNAPFKETVDEDGNKIIVYRNKLKTVKHNYRNNGNGHRKEELINILGNTR